MASTVASSPLATADQIRLEQKAIEILNTDPMRAQIEKSYALCRESDLYKTDAGRRSMVSAIQELAGWAATNAANSDTHRPALTWTITPPRTWHGHRVPGTRWIFDNADNVYRYIVIDGASRYRLSCRPTGPRGSFSVTVYSYFTGEEGKKMEGAHAGLLEKDMVFEADGSIVITLDADPADGRPNHLQIEPEARLVMVREALSDWDNQRPQEMRVERVGGAEKDPPSLAAMTELAVKWLADATITVLNFETRYSPLPTNGFAKSVRRSAGFGLIKLCRFELAADEALLVTAEDVGGRYRAASLDTPWLVTCEHVHRSATLNNTQTEACDDGSCTYVVCASDPGVANWLDTGGLDQGGLAIRWEGLTRPVDDPDAAIRQIRVVKIADLAAHAPELRKVGPEERKRASSARAASWKLRCGDVDVEPHAEFEVGLN